MLLMGKMFYVSTQSREKDGKTYSSVVLAGDDGAITVSADSDIDFGSLKRFQEYACIFNYGTFKGEGYLKLMNMEPITTAAEFETAKPLPEDAEPAKEAVDTSAGKSAKKQSAV